MAIVPFTGFWVRHLVLLWLKRYVVALQKCQSKGRLVGLVAKAEEESVVGAARKTGNIAPLAYLAECGKVKSNIGRSFSSLTSIIMLYIISPYRTDPPLCLPSLIVASGSSPARRAKFADQSHRLHPDGDNLLHQNQSTTIRLSYLCVSYHQSNIPVKGAACHRHTGTAP